MFKKIGSIAFCFVCALADGPALARYDFDFSTDQPTTNTPWEWYFQSIPLTFNGFADGYFPGEGPYIRFYGVDRSPQGHCLELSFSIDNPDTYFNVEAADHATRQTVMSVQGGYSTMRLYVHNTNPSDSRGLTWTLYFVDVSGANSGSMFIRRKQYRNGGLDTVRELTRDECTLPLDGIPSVYVEGAGTSYTVGVQ